MHYKYEILTSIDAIQWNDNLKKSDSSTFFQTFEYLSQKSSGVIPVYVRVFDNNGEIVGQLGLRIIKTAVMYSSKTLRHLLNLISNITNRAIWVYGPIIHSNVPENRNAILNEILKAIDEIGKTYDLVHIEGQTSPFDSLIKDSYKQIFKDNNYRKIDHITFVTELTKSKDEIWNNISKKARGDVNRAKRRNITVKVLETYDELKKYFLLNMEWTKSKGLVITDIDHETEILWKNHLSGIEKIFLAFQDNDLISGMRVGCFNGICYTNFVINSYAEKTNLGGSILNWFVLEWAKENNMRIYDFSGGEAATHDVDKIGKDSDSLLFYKSKWGGAPKKYYVFIKIRKKISYKIYRLLFGLMRQYHGAIKQ